MKRWKSPYITTLVDFRSRRSPTDFAREAFFHAPAYQGMVRRALAQAHPAYGAGADSGTSALCEGDRRTISESRARPADGIGYRDLCDCLHAGCPERVRTLPP